jgi:hypothetical protein
MPHRSLFAYSITPLIFNARWSNQLHCLRSFFRSSKIQKRPPLKLSAASVSFSAYKTKSSSPIAPLLHAQLVASSAAVSPSRSPAGASRHQYWLPLVKTKLRCLNLKPCRPRDWPRRRRPSVWHRLIRRGYSLKLLFVVVRLKLAAAMHVGSVMVSV